MGICLLTSAVKAEPLERIIGGPGKDGVRKMIRTQGGGFALAGWQDQEGIHGSGTGLLVNLTADGTVLWQKTLSTDGRNQVSSVVQRTDGSFVAVVEEYPATDKQGDVVLVELTNDGEEIARHRVGGPGSDVADTIRLTSDGGYVLAGESATTNGGNLDAWVAKVSSSFDVIWEWRQGTAGRDRFNDLVVLPDGTMVAAGNATTSHTDGSTQEQAWLVKFDAEGNVLWSSKPVVGRAASIRGLTTSATGGYVFAGFSKRPETRRFDSWLGKINADGGLQWQQSVDQDGGDFLHSVMPTSNSSYIAAGAVRIGADEGYDAMVITFDDAGQAIQPRHAGGAASEQARYVIPLDTKAYVLAGAITPQNTTNEQMWFYRSD